MRIGKVLVAGVVVGILSFGASPYRVGKKVSMIYEWQKEEGCWTNIVSPGFAPKQH